MSDEGRPGTLNAQSTTPPPGPVDRFMFGITILVGLALVVMVVAAAAVGLPMKWDKWIVATGIALLCGAFSSRVAVSLQMPALGQSITMGGTFAAMFILVTQVADPAPQIGRGVIQVQPGLEEVVLRTGRMPIFVRRGGDNRSVEFLVTLEELQAPYWDITISMDENGKRRSRFISCLPTGLLAPAINRARVLNFVLESIVVTDRDTSQDRVFKLRLDEGSEALGIPEYTAPCSSRPVAALSASGARPQVITAPPPPDRPAPPAAPPAVAPSPPVPAAAPAVVPSPPVPAAAPQISISEATRALRSDSLTQRVNASATIGDAVAASPDALSQTVATWRIATSDYDDDLGNLLSWLRPLRRSRENPAQAKRLLDALSPAQAAYLVALLANQDRPLRLAAREVVGWLLQAGSKSPGLQKLLTPITDNLRTPTAVVKAMEDKFQQPSRPRKFLVFNLVDVQFDAWCGYSDVQRQSMLQVIGQVSSTDIGVEGVNRSNELRARECTS